jgi:predicted aminopeptidase
MLAAMPLMVGCEGVFYVTHLASGQLGIQGGTEPITAVLESGRLTDDEQAKLELMVKARQFAADEMGLNVGGSYATFYDTQGDPLAWNLSAARRDALVPVTWTFPIVGEVPYLAFFDEAYLRREEQRLLDQGYDTETYELDAYSTLGVFEDPVRSTMLRRGSLSLVETVIHELLHNTVWRPNETVFNESLATFVGRQGAIAFLAAEFGEDSGWPDVARAFYADLESVNAFLLELYAELEAYYAQDIPAGQKIAGREAVFQAARERFTSEVLPTLSFPESFGGYADLPTNNAWMLANYRYNLDLDVIEAVYIANGTDWRAALDVFGAAAAAPGDPFQYLRDWLAAQSP